MKRLFISLFFLLSCLKIFSQEKTVFIEGKVSFISSQSVYVKFVSTSRLKKGDTLYLKTDMLTPVLIVKSLSSISGVCEPTGTVSLKINDPVFGRIVLQKEEKTGTEVVETSEDTIVIKKVDVTPLKKPKARSNNFRGRISINSYSGFSAKADESFQRMRYIASFSADRIKGTNFYAESYLTFNNKSGDWSEIQNNLNKGLKIYNLAFTYKSPKGTEILLGRKINSKFSNVGAIDGLQFTQKIRSISIGGFAGSRPDHEDYGFNPDLLQYGAFISHSGNANKGYYQSSFALVEQKNKSFTDRQFIYFQHYNTVLKNLYTFVSFEADLYQNINNIAQGAFNLTGLYFLLRYNVTKKLRISTSYDVRNNVIYYETYKSYLDQLLQTEARQGFNLRLNYRLSKIVSIGATGTYRFRRHDPSPSANYSTFVSLRDIFLRGSYTNVSVNVLSTSFLNGGIFSIGYRYPVIAGKLYGSLRYRFFRGQYKTIELLTTQHITELNLSWFIYKNLVLNFNYELQVENKYLNNRLYIQLSKRF